MHRLMNKKLLTQYKGRFHCCTNWPGRNKENKSKDGKTILKANRNDAIRTIGSDFTNAAFSFLVKKNSI